MVRPAPTLQAQLDHRPRFNVSLTYLNGGKSKKPKAVYKMVLRASSSVTGKELVD
jgi:hypothetical protein